MSQLVRALGRQHRAWIGSWLLVVGALVVATLPSYASTYPTAQARRVAVDRAQEDGASLLLYGRLPDPGDPAQMFTWETGAFLTILVSVLGVLLAVRLTRGAEDDGTVELVRSCGLGVDVPLRAALVVLLAVAAALGGLVAGGLGLRAGNVDGIDLVGCLMFAGTVSATFLLFALITCAAAQVFPSARGTRTSGTLAIAAAFALRAAGDTLDVGALSWLSPLGLRETVSPFTEDEWSPLALAAAVALALGTVATTLVRRRDLGGGLLPSRDRTSARLRVRSPTALAWRLSRSGIAVWVLAVAAGGSLFTALGSGVVESARDGQLSGGFLEAQLGGQDPAASYFAYTGTVVGIVVAVLGILMTVQVAGEERRGLTEHLRALGVRAAAPLAGQALVAAAAVLVTLLVTGLALAAVAAQTVTGTDVARTAVVQIVGQTPSVLALIGVAVLLIGLSPRLAWAAWLPFVASAGLGLLGELLGAPPWLLRLGVFGNLPVEGWGGSDVAAILVLVTLAFAGTAGGLWAVQRRDLVLGL